MACDKPLPALVYICVTSMSENRNLKYLNAYINPVSIAIHVFNVKSMTKACKPYNTWQA